MYRDPLWPFVVLLIDLVGIVALVALTFATGVVA